MLVIAEGGRRGWLSTAGGEPNTHYSAINARQRKKRRKGGKRSTPRLYDKTTESLEKDERK